MENEEGVYEKMKKILALMAIVVLMFSLAACGSKKEEGDSQEMTVVGVISNATEESFTLTLEDETTMDFTTGAATRNMLDNGFQDGLKVSVLYTGEGADQMLLMVEAAK